MSGIVYRLRSIVHSLQLAAILLPCIFIEVVAADTGEIPDIVTALEGDWQGRAVQTPVGPAPYDIRFRRVEGNCLRGTADNGFSQHTWTFCRDSGALTLAFLSDFRGNDQPIHMREISRRENSVVFHADSHDFMDVHLSVQEDSADVEVRHHGELHVHIRWRRPPGPSGTP